MVPLPQNGRGQRKAKDCVHIETEFIERSEIKVTLVYTDCPFVLRFLPDENVSLSVIYKAKKIKPASNCIVTLKTKISMGRDPDDTA